MIITCPNCQSRYEVAAQALGERGRKVECASCHANWKALPLPESAPVPEDRLFTADEENELDVAFEAEAAKVSTNPPADMAPQNVQTTANIPADPEQVARLDRQRKALEKRQQVLKRNLPQAKLRRAWRLILAVVLMSLVGGGVVMREQIVRAVPDLAGIYAAVGLKVNVVGLEFDEVKTLRSMRDGSEVLQITANLVNITHRQVAVPPVLVTLLDGEGNVIFEWSVVPHVRVIQAGDGTEFATQLTSPPAGAADMHLSFLEQPSGNGG